jgi:alkaline phosphatase
MISDGYGPASETFARSYLQHLISVDDPLIKPSGRWASLNPRNDPTSSYSTRENKKKGDDIYSITLPLDQMLIGQSRTRSSDSLVTDSAAGATAFSCAMKSYNGAIAVEPEEADPCGTVLEAAKHQGYRTGLVVTSVSDNIAITSSRADVLDTSVLHMQHPQLSLLTYHTETWSRR